MAQYDVYEVEGAIFLDLQSDAIAIFETRLVAPLVPVEDAPSVVAR